MSYSSSSTASRVFRGCRALLAPVKSSAAASSPAPAPVSSAKSASSSSKAATKSKSKGNALSFPTPRTPSRPAGIQKVSPVSPALAQFLNASEASRVDAVKQIWSYIKDRGLQDPNDKRQIYCDEKLKSIFDNKDKVGFLEIGKLLSRHFVKTS